MSRHFSPLSLERLEDRDCPAPLTIVLDASGTLRISGSPTGTLTLNVTAANQIQVLDGAKNDGTYQAFALVLNLGNTDDSVALNLTGGGLAGNVTMNTANGNDSVTITGAGGNGLAGNLSLSGVNSLFMNSAPVAGNFSLNAEGSAAAQFFTLINSPIGGNASLNASVAGVNFVTLAGNNVGGILSVNLGTSLQNFLSTDVATTVGGSLIYTGGNQANTLALGGTVLGNEVISVGNGTNVLAASGLSAVHGNFTYVGGNGANLLTNLDGTYLGSVAIFLGNGGNTVTTNATVLGPAFTLYTGGGADFVTFNAVAPGVRLTANLGGGDDAFNFGAAVNLQSAYIDGGFGSNTFTAVNPIAFPLVLRNF